MTIDELITRLEDLKKVAKNGGKTEVKLYKPNHLYKDEAYTCQILTIC